MHVCMYVCMYRGSDLRKHTLISGESYASQSFDPLEPAPAASFDVPSPCRLFPSFPLETAPEAIDSVPFFVCENDRKQVVHCVPEFKVLLQFFTLISASEHGLKTVKCGLNKRSRDVRLLCASKSEELHQSKPGPSSCLPWPWPLRSTPYVFGQRKPLLNAQLNSLCKLGQTVTYCWSQVLRHLEASRPHCWERSPCGDHKLVHGLTQAFYLLSCPPF